MSETVIRASGLTKGFSYWTEPPTSLKTWLVNSLRGRLRPGELRRFNVLENVNFEIRRGEFVGIMGRNGAGKSTLLKLISGIYSPTAGRIEVGGQIAPLIELGAGFDGDLSGFENIFLNGAILGFGRAAVHEALPRILEFAELGDMIQMPVRNYSSGMLVRLGFSIATHLAAPIVLLDEVLAVGDVAFQQKSLRKIDELHREGRTIVLITHDPDSVKRHCTRCIVIDGGRKVFDGATAEGVAHYLAAIGVGNPSTVK